MKKLLENDVYALVQGKRGYYLVNKHDIFIGKEILHYGEFGEVQFELFAQVIRPGFTVLDIGANIGGYTIGFAQAVGPTGQVWAYEPQPAVFQNLCSNMALNGLMQVKTFNAGLGAEAGSINIPPIRYDRAHNFGGISLESLPQDMDLSTSVPIYTLDEHFNGHRLDFIKIDVEGMELDVLKGAVKTIDKFKPIIYAENDRKEKSKELLSFIFDELGYKAWWHIPPLFNPNNFAGIEENIIGNYISKNILCLPKDSQTKVEKLKPVESVDEFIG